MRDRHTTPPPRAFVLLEVLVSLAILGIAMAMLLQSFTTSMKAAGNSEKITVATILARDLLDQWEINPPPSGSSEEDVGEEHPGYSYRVEYDNQTQPNYRDVPMIKEGRLAVLRRISLDILYKKKSTDKVRRILHVETALSSSERFNSVSRQHNEIRFDK